MILTEERRQIEQIYTDLKADCKRLKVRQKHLAYVLGISQAGVSHLIHDRKLSLEQFVYIRVYLRSLEKENGCTR